MMLSDYRINPSDEPDVIGTCISCGEDILANEPYRIAETGDKIHDCEDCKINFADRMFSAA